MKLISMTDFVLENAKQPYVEGTKYKDLVNYANFLKQPLKLEMFVTCDNYGNVLFNPFADDNDAGTDKEYKQTQYNKAKEKVLFEGFIITDETEFLISKYGFSLYFNQIEDFNVEQLLTWSNEIQLTENAIKQIRL